jgi:hypothetical protein
MIYIAGDHQTSGITETTQASQNSFHKGQSEMSDLISYLVEEQRHQSLESLALQAQMFEDEAIHRLCSYMVLNTSLANVSLNGIRDSDESVGWLSEVIEKSTTLEKLDLEQSTWTIKSILRIMDALCVNKSLISVNLNCRQQIDKAIRLDITKKLRSCLDANRGIIQLSNQLICANAEGATIAQKLQRNAEEFSKQVRLHCVGAMMKVFANEIPKELIKIILQLSRSLQQETKFNLTIE